MRNQKFVIIYGIIFIMLMVGSALFWQYNTQKPESNIPSVPPGPSISVSPSSTNTTVSPHDPITTTPSVMSIKVYFGSDQSLPGEECTTMYPVIREIPRTQAVARAALEELLKGPSQSEQDQGYYTSINSGVRVQKIGIEDGEARVDFSSRMNVLTASYFGF